MAFFASNHWHLCARKNIYRRTKWKKTLKSSWLREIPVVSKVTASCTIFVWKYILRTLWQIMYEELADKKKKMSSCIRNVLFFNSGLCRLVYYWAFHPFFVTWFLVVFGDKVTKILRNTKFIFFFYWARQYRQNTNLKQRKSCNQDNKKPKNEATKISNEPGICYM